MKNIPRKYIPVTCVFLSPTLHQLTIFARRIDLTARPNTDDVRRHRVHCRCKRYVTSSCITFPSDINYFMCTLNAILVHISRLGEVFFPLSSFFLMKVDIYISHRLSWIQMVAVSCADEKNKAWEKERLLEMHCPGFRFLSFLSFALSLSCLCSLYFLFSTWFWWMHHLILDQVRRVRLRLLI